jgi:hypothetical protein
VSANQVRAIKVSQLISARYGLIGRIRRVGSKHADRLHAPLWPATGITSRCSFTSCTLSPSPSGPVSNQRMVPEKVQTKSEIPFGRKVADPDHKLCGLMNGRITSIRVETRRLDAEVFSSHKQSIRGESDSVTSFGAVRGRIQSLTSRGTLRFTLYDAEDDHAISCYLREGSEDVMGTAWGKLAFVEGIIRRDSRSGKVSTVRDVSQDGVQVVQDEGIFHWRDATGCAPAVKGSISAEEAVRRGRE